MHTKVKAVATVTKKVQRGEKSTNMLRWALALSVGVAMAIINAIVQEPVPKVVAIISAVAALWLLFRESAWFQNKVIGVISRSEERWRSI